MNVVVLASGRGSNFAAILAARKAGRLGQIKIKALITDRLDTGASQHARQAGILVIELDYKAFSERSLFEDQLTQKLGELQPDWILALGFMRVLPAAIVQAYPKRIINIHPSLLPAFKGMHAQRQAFEYGVKISGCTVHLIDEGVDTGPILDQQAVDIRDARSADEVSELILEQEHQLLVRVLEKLAI